MLKLMLGTGIGQLIALIFIPVLTRLFSPENFAALESYMFLLMLAGIIATARYEFAIVQAKEKEEARSIASLSFWLACFMAGIWLLLSLTIPSLIANWSGSPTIQPWLWTLAPLTLAAAVTNITSYWFNRERQFHVAATGKALYSAASEPIKAGIGWLHANASGLITGTFLGQMVTGIYCYYQFWKKEPGTFFQSSKWEMQTVAQSYIQYPKYNLLGSLLNHFAQWIHVAVFFVVYGQDAFVPIAFIALSRRLIQNPLGLFATSFSQVFYQRISQITDAKELQRYFLSNSKKLLWIGLLPIALAWVLPNNLMGWVLGEDWSDAMAYLRILSIWFGLNFVTSSVSFIFFRLHLQRINLTLDAIHFIAVIVGFYLARYFGLDVMQAVYVLVIIKFLFICLNWLSMFYFVRQYTNQNTVANS
ncbi:MAG: oligosaccharide flippase family protein [Flavobacteriales bacterium]